MNKQRLIYVLTLVASFSFSFAIAFFLTPANSSMLNPAITGAKEIPKSASGIVVNPDEPKDQICPTNGQKYTATEKKVWESRLPILSMIENTTEARPQSGLSSADIIYEAVAEGGVTRFMGVFYCNVANAVKVGPVRSARMYFVNLAAEYNSPIYMHVGGGNCSAADPGGPCTTHKKALAIEELQKMKWRKAKGRDFDTTFDSGAPVLIRDYFRLGKGVQLATEHTMVGDLIAAWREGDKRGLYQDIKDGKSWSAGFTSWKFKDQFDDSKLTSATNISFEFWKGWPEFNVNWQYDSGSGYYKRSVGGSPQIDLENKEQLAAKNVVIQFAKQEGPLDDHKHLFYDVVSNGKATFFINGKTFDGTWKKTSQIGRTVFMNAQGKEVEFARGQIWVEILPTINKLEIQ